MLDRVYATPYAPRVTLDTVDTVITFTLPALSFVRSRSRSFGGDNTRHDDHVWSGTDVVNEDEDEHGHDDKHVNDLVDDQVREYEKRGYISLLHGVTVAAHHGILHVLDGERRIRAYVELLARGYPVGNVLIPVVHYVAGDRQELVDLYRSTTIATQASSEAKRGCAVSNYIPGSSSASSSASLSSACWTRFGGPFVEWLTVEAYPAYVKDDKNGSGTRCPHIGIRRLKEEVRYRHDDLRVSCGGDPQVLRESVACFNACMESIYVKSDRASNMSANTLPFFRRLKECHEKTGRKPEQTPCFFGAFRNYEWLDVCANCIRKRTRVDVATCMALVAASDKRERRRRPIPYEVRCRVWEKTNRSDCTRGSCYACERPLDFKDMECGHVTARAMGGADSLHNLMPVCRTCNRDMGVQDMEDYRKRIRDMLSDAHIKKSSSLIH
jgi:5-methylcytosine-specific restriction endonuclease McrA